jgi:hypothetical protein
MVSGLGATAALANDSRKTSRISGAVLRRTGWFTVPLCLIVLVSRDRWPGTRISARGNG